jgi:hypothetical protein
MEPAPGKRVTWDATHRRFVLNGTTPLKGITKVLQKRFYPRYTEARATHGPRDPRTDTRESRAVRLAAGANGTELGRAVDGEVAQWTQLAWAHQLGWPHLVPAVTAAAPQGTWPRPPARLAPADRARLVHLQQNANLYTRRFLAELQRRGLYPLAAQVPVGSLDARCGTAVDLVCVRTRALGTAAVRPGARLAPGTPVVLIELKCGYDRTFRLYSGCMKAPLAHLRDSPLEQHQLQLLVTRILFQRTYRTAHPVADAAVVRVHGSGIEWVPQRAWTLEEEVAVFAALVRAREAPATTRRKSRAKRRLVAMQAMAAALGGVYAPPPLPARARKRPRCAGP